MTTERQVRLLAEHFDMTGKPDQPIAVIGTRACLRRVFKPDERGGPLKVGSHELQLVRRPPKGDAQNLDWVGEQPA